MTKVLREIADMEAQIAKKRLIAAQHQANIVNWTYAKSMANIKAEIGQMERVADLDR